MTHETSTEFFTNSQFMNLENFNSKVKISSSQSHIQSEYELDDYTDLERRYASVERYIKELSNGQIHNLIINGPAGVGKTHAVETFLGKYAQGRYKVVKGHMTPLSLYGNLYFHRDPNSILVLDDIDSVFKKIEGVNLLKAAMDTGSVRRINWESSNALKGVGIPDSFEFKGKVILISNIGFSVARKNSISAHLDALKDRSFNIVVADNTKESCFKQVCFMVLKKDMLHAFKLTYELKVDLLDYLKDHITVIDKISLRTAIKLAQLINISPANRRDESAQSGAILGSVLSSVSTLLQIMLLCQLLAPQLTSLSMKPIGTGIATIIVVSLVAFNQLKNGQETQQLSITDSEIFDWKSLLILTIVVISISYLSGLLFANYGNSSLPLIAAISGLADAHAIIPSLAAFVNQGILQPQDALMPMMIAFTVNTLTKCLIAFQAGGKKFGLKVSVGLGLTAAGAWLGLIFQFP